MIYTLVCKLFLFLLWKSREKKLHCKKDQVSDSVQWVHVSSQGEWEAMRPVVDELLHHQHKPMILTCFSLSAYSSVKKYAENQPLILAYGLSPCEGYWDKIFKTYSVSLFLTTKYEAWPDLWLQCQKRQVPVMILNSRWRMSLKTVFYFFRYILFKKFPKLILGVDHKDPALLSHFSGAKILEHHDPRWDRMLKRSKELDPSLLKKLDQLKSNQKKIMIFAQIWKSDFQEIQNALERLPSDTVCFVVPHQIGTELYEDWKQLVAASSSVKIQDLKNDTWSFESKDFYWFDCMGILPELYSISDYAYVGGGYEKGVHSTIEPAVFGLPILCGPKKTETFQEIKDLQQMDQLRVVRNSEKDWNWIFQKNRYSEEKLRQFYGSTHKIVECVIEESKKGIRFD